jgi:hypothetical protein
MAAFRACVTNFSARRANVTDQIRTAQDEVGGGPAQLSACRHEPEVIRFQMLATRLEAVNHRPTLARFIAIKARTEALLQVFV